MITIKDLAKNLISKHQVSASDGELFIQQMVEVINDGLLRDRQVKIKGFGTFKLMAVKERSSINVNTGERVTIGEHDKITFTPDNTMKDLINKPFAQFDTVIVADDSPLLDGSFEIDSVEDDDDEEDEIAVEVMQQPVAPPVEKAVEVTTPAPTEELVVTPAEEPTPITVAQPQDEPNEAEEQETKEAPVLLADKVTLNEEVKQEVVNPYAHSSEVSEEPTEEPAKEQDNNEPSEEEDDSCSRQYPHCRNIFIYYGILINIVVAIIAFAAGYFLCDYMNDSSPVVLHSESQNVTKPVENKTTVPAKTPAKKVEAAKVQPQREVAVKDDAAKENLTKDNQTKEDPTTSQYNKDARLRYGAYYIMGTSQVITVKKGQTLKSLSRLYLGPDMDCYVEVYNGCKEVEAGDQVRIPELKLKKLVNKQKAKK